jgi:ABC-type branched-chain amino acid transport systems, periplasmic component
MSFQRRAVATAAFCLGAALLVAATSVHGQKRYGPGVTDTEIKIGQTISYSGPGSVYAITGRVYTAYMKMVNESGGINGRKVNLLSLDDAYTPPKTVEVTRKLVEQDEVLAMVGSMGTGPQIAVQKYLNGRKVPQMFITGSSPLLHDPKNNPWTLTFSLAYDIEGEIYANYLLQAKPNAKIGLLYQNDDMGKAFMRSIRKGLGAKADAMIVKELTYESTDPTIDSQVLAMQASGADTFISIATNKFQAQAIRKADAIGWKPTYIVPYIASSVSAVLTPAGLERSAGIISAAWFKSPSDPRWAGDKGMQDYLGFMKKYLPADDPGDTTPAYMFMGAQLSTMALKRAGDNLTRENLLKQATTMGDVELPMLLPGIKVALTPSNYYMIRKAQIVQFDGKAWNPVGGVVSAGAQ